MNQPTRPGYEGLLEAWRELAAQRLFTFTEILVGSPARKLCYIDIDAARKPHVFISAGVHGDEPVSPWSLYTIVRDGLLDPHFSYRLWFCTNPTGYDLGTRKNIDGVDINRSYTGEGLTPESEAVIRLTLGHEYVLAIDLHEDFESDGFYLYEPIVGQTAPYGRKIIAEISDAGFPLQQLDDEFDLGYPRVDLGYPLEAATAMRLLEPGRVLPDIMHECQYFADGLPLTMFLLRNGAKRALTFETPRRAAWDDRIAMHRIAVVTALSQIQKIEGI